MDLNKDFEKFYFDEQHAPYWLGRTALTFGAITGILSYLKEVKDLNVAIVTLFLGFFLLPLYTYCAVHFYKSLFNDIKTTVKKWKNQPKQ